MSALVVHAHPVPESYSAALCQAVVEGLSSNHSVDVADLNRGDDPTADELVSVETLVLVYPTWWSGFPAVLLDWMQRTLSPWIDDGTEGPSPLRNVRTVVVVTTYGSGRIINALQGEAGRSFVSRPLARLCSDRVRVEWLALYAIEKRDASERTSFIEHVRSRCASLR